MKHAIKVWNMKAASMNLWSFWGAVIRSSQASLFKVKFTESLLGAGGQGPGSYFQATANWWLQQLCNTGRSACCQHSCMLPPLLTIPKEDEGLNGQHRLPHSLLMASGPGGVVVEHTGQESLRKTPQACKTHQKADAVGQILRLDRNIIKPVQEWVTTHNRWDYWCHS